MTMPGAYIRFLLGPAFRARGFMDSHSMSLNSIPQLEYSGVSLISLDFREYMQDSL